MTPHGLDEAMRYGSDADYGDGRSATSASD